ncbi:MAG: ParB/RepB/Spo0J family partition protein [Daejeonella sp.]|uniref:ParB/RepB/Spo0J family partition protein n=1 Tax=Daejeonella sp. TaxID=2805397 RepID=UPI002734FD30|nr:ParB/RepB/Spo0J family partition protein [Daejeonella sp.]MDP3468719.1 ParB/RepB/Spo0J family partition protein [Daejeonella sp.]
MIYQKKTGLGRGLRALLDDSDLPENDRQQVSNESSSLGSISSVKISQVQVNPFQPRTDFDPEALQELAESIKLQGLIQPITVRQSGQNSYQLISGERRLRASRLAGLTEIPAYVRTANDQQMLEMALIENIQRENLNAIEVALSFQRMIDECNLKQEQLGERVSKNRSTVTNYLRLLKLPPAIQASIRDKEISMGHARALISVEDVDKQLYLFQEIINRGLSVRKVEELVRQLQSIGEGKKPVKAVGMSFQYMKIQDDLASKFSTNVKLKLSEKGKGSIEIGFMSDDDLNRILEMLDW